MSIGQRSAFMEKDTDRLKDKYVYRGVCYGH